MKTKLLSSAQKHPVVSHFIKSKSQFYSAYKAPYSVAYVSDLKPTTLPCVHSEPPMTSLSFPLPEIFFPRASTWHTPSWPPSLCSKVTFSVKSSVIVLLKVINFPIHNLALFFHILLKPVRQTLPMCLLPVSLHNEATQRQGFLCVLFTAISSRFRTEINTY